MWDLIGSVASSSLIFVVFKLYSRFRVATFYAIIGNYFTAFLVGILFFPRSVPLAQLPAKPWFLPAVSLGLLFILIFNLMARTSQQLGVSVASVATKMSLVIPVIAGMVLYGEKLGAFRVFGIALALVAVYLASVKAHRVSWNPRLLYLPGLVFLGSGIIDTSIKYLEENHIPDSEYPLFSACVFGAAGTTGAVITLFRTPQALFAWRPKNLLGGVALGIPNFFSVFFLLRALQFPGLNSASIFTLNNVGIVLLTTLLGIALFEEKLAARNWLGVILAVVSIAIISL
ncbi:DMT family transporter [Robiginitalea sp. SC105]|uniref:DMT family transporter n=1 Tax=Robiginitalea sp. SC105 TaxID=2762332 RepID=UPI00163B0206|nr:DMT family transporter [Robiginitalea sp. SC105]MBC2840782.1 DMT family transporter [Robiginitalea sp. SC105]